MGTYISCLFDWLFRDSHSDGEFEYTLLLCIIGYISKTYWDASRISIQAMKEEYELVYGPPDDHTSVTYDYDFDQVWEQM